MLQVTKIHIKGRKLVCSFCKKDLFVIVDGLANEKWYAFLDMEIFSKQTKICICQFCGHIEEFVDQQSGW